MRLFDAQYSDLTLAVIQTESHCAFAHNIHAIDVSLRKMYMCSPRRSLRNQSHHDAASDTQTLQHANDVDAQLLEHVGRCRCI